MLFSTPNSRRPMVSVNPTGQSKWSNGLSFVLFLFYYAFQLYPINNQNDRTSEVKGIKSQMSISLFPSLTAPCSPASTASTHSSLTMTQALCFDILREIASHIRLIDLYNLSLTVSQLSLILISISTQLETIVEMGPHLHPPITLSRYRTLGLSTRP